MYGMYYGLLTAAPGISGHLGSITEDLNNMHQQHFTLLFSLNTISSLHSPFMYNT